MDGMIRVFVESPEDDSLKFVLKHDSTFGYLKEAVARHFDKDLATLQLYIGDELLCLQDDVPISTMLKTGDTLQVRNASAAKRLSDLSSDSLLSLNGGYSEEEALQVALSQVDTAKDGFDEASIQRALRFSLNTSSEFHTESSQVECSSEPEFSIEPTLMGEPFDESFTKEDCKPPAVDLSPSITASTANSSSHTLTMMPGLFERDDYEDPISKEIMADPVKCSDGYTYERQNIERHFRTCIESEQQRQAELESGQPTESADACCGARIPVELISPLTGGVVSDTLLPDKNLERTIVRLVENNALGMTEEEIRDWTQLREEKRVHDREREQELQAARANELRMAEQAAQAEERRRAERISSSASMEAAPTNDGNALPAARVRVDRNVRIESEKLCENDLGLSVSLCEQGDRIFPEYIIASSQQVRCMVACCAGPMDPEHPTWCDRCGRIICQDCLNFGVTDISTPNPKSMHAVCSECVRQTLDAIDLSDPRCCQTRDIIQTMNLQQDAARLRNAAADAQDHIVRFETNEAYQPRLEALRRDIESFQSRRQALVHQIQTAKENARRTREAEGTDEDSLYAGSSSNETLSPQDIESLQQRHQQLEQELARLGQDIPEDEEAQIAYVIQREEASVELVQVQARLLEALASPNTRDHNEEEEGEQERNAASLEALNREYHRLVASRPPDDDEDAQMQYFARLSELASTVERAQIRHAASEPLQESVPEVTGALNKEAGTASDTQALSRLLAAVEQYRRRRFHRNRPGRPRKSYIRRLRELTSTVSQTEAEGTSHSASYRRLIGELREHIDQLPRQCSGTLAAEVRAARLELDRKENVSSVMTGDPMEEMLRLQRVDVSSLGEEEQIEHVMRVSEVQQTLDLLEGALLGSSADRIDSDDTKNVPMQQRQQQQSFEGLGGPQAQSRQANNSQAKRAHSASTIPVQPASEAAVDDPESVPVNSTESSFSFTTLIRGIGGLVSYFSSPVATQANEAPVDLDECRARLEAIGKRDTQWRLPLGLEYPTQSMDDQLEILKNSLELRLVDSQRRWEHELSQVEDKLADELQELENTVQSLMTEANNAEASAAQAQAQLQERRRQRALERQRQEARRREEERRREEQERRAQAEAQALQERHEEQTRQAFVAVRGGRNQARTFGGSGDLRMCRRCKAGPFENKACADLDAHNGREHANHCPNCDWHDPNWHNWPYFDGIYGPH
jgi:hypothetical protein